MVIDITVTGRELLNQVFAVQKKEFEKAFTAKDLATMRKCATLMREVLKDIDGINAFQSHCTLDSWINLARDYGNTPELKDY